MGALDLLIYGYRTILSAGSELTQRAKLNFTSGFEIADNEVTGATDVSLSISGSDFTIAGEARGNLIQRGASAWQALAQGAAGTCPVSGGTGADTTFGYPAGLAIASQATGDGIYFNGTSWVRRAIGSTGNVYQVSGGVPTWAALNLAGGAGYVTGALPTANQVAQSLGGSLGGTTASGTVVQIDGTGGVATILCDEVKWGNGTKGTRSIRATANTTTNSANQTILTIAVPTNVAYDLFVRVVATDTGASGAFRSTWADDFFARRTGTDYGNGSGNLARVGSAPTAANVKSVGSLTSATSDVTVSSNNILVRGSPGATANITWETEAIVLLGPLS